MHLQKWKWFDDKSVKITASIKITSKFRCHTWSYHSGSIILVTAVKKCHYFHFIPLGNWWSMKIFILSQCSVQFWNYWKKIITISLYKLRTQQHNFSLIHWLIFTMFYVVINTASALNFPMWGRDNNDHVQVLPLSSKEISK